MKRFLRPAFATLLILGPLDGCSNEEMPTAPPPSAALPKTDEAATKPTPKEVRKVGLEP